MKKNERKIIHKSLDGELNKEETREFHFSLKNDPEVRRAWEQLKALEERSKQALQPLPPPENFTEKVIGKIRDTDRRKRGT